MHVQYLEWMYSAHMHENMTVKSCITPSPFPGSVMYCVCAQICCQMSGKNYRCVCLRKSHIMYMLLFITNTSFIIIRLNTERLTIRSEDKKYETTKTVTFHALCTGDLVDVLNGQ